MTNLLSGSTYWALGAEQRAILAGERARFAGAPLARFPPTQAAAESLLPMAGKSGAAARLNEKPIGGRFEPRAQSRARVRVTENIGIVPCRRWQLLREPGPLGRTLLYGVGLGLRYYTAFGPLRLDLATPLHRRSADSPIQVYISLGQAF